MHFLNNQWLCTAADWHKPSKSSSTTKAENKNKNREKKSKCTISEDSKASRKDEKLWKGAEFNSK